MNFTFRIAEQRAFVDELDDMGMTRLMHAADEGKVKEVEDLLLRGADPNKPADNFQEPYTPLMLAAYQGHVEVVQRLIKGGASVDREEEGDGWTALLFAAKEGNSDVVSLLLSAKANPNWYVDDDCTALSLASHNGHEEVVKELLAFGAEVMWANECRRA